MASSNLSGLSFYVPGIGRPETEKILRTKRDGVFLIRDSRSIIGDYVLSVRENNKVSHYIINNKGSHFQIGENSFQDIPSIVEFYKRHLLETTTLVESAVVDTPCNIKVKALYNFAGNDVEDLPFRRGDILTVISKPEEKWWKAQDSTGKQGLIPVNYIQAPPNTPPQQSGPMLFRTILERKVAYDPTQLNFEVGETIKVLEMNENGTWYGELLSEESGGKKGYFPFSHVKPFVDEKSQDDINRF